MCVYRYAGSSIRDLAAADAAEFGGSLFRDGMMVVPQVDIYIYIYIHVCVCVCVCVSYLSLSHSHIYIYIYDIMRQAASERH